MSESDARLAQLRGENERLKTEFGDTVAMLAADNRKLADLLKEALAADPSEEIVKLKMELAELYEEVARLRALVPEEKTKAGLVRLEETS